MAQRKLNIFYQNVRGLRTKILDFHREILRNNFDILIITETWLHSGVLDGEICDSRYSVFRLDRDESLINLSPAGGVMILLRNELDGTLLVNTNASRSTEILWVTIPSKSLNRTSTNLHIAVIYIPGNIHLPREIENCINSISHVFNQHPNDHFLIVGDFNLYNIQWDVHLGPLHMKRGSIELQKAGQSLVDELSHLGLEQCNFIRNSSGNTIDLVFSNFSATSDRSLISLVPKEDVAHPTMIIDADNITLQPLKHNNNTLKYNFKICDFELMKNYLSKIDWLTVFDSCDNINEALDYFNNELHKCIEQFVPKRKLSKKCQYPVWYNKTLSNILSEKFKAHTLWKRFKNDLDYIEFSKLRARAKRLEIQLYNEYIYYIQNSIKMCPKNMWKYVKQMRSKSNYPKTLTHGSQVVTDGPDICNSFNIFFKSVFVEPMPHYNISQLDLPNCSETVVNNVVVSHKTLHKLLLSLDINKSAGPDNIPPVFIRGCADVLVYPLKILFEKSLSEGVFPQKWKEANVVPVHKKSSKSKIENYRPISILNTFSKIFEKIVYDQIYSTIANGVSITQHGFLKNRSTVTNLTEFIQFVLKNMESGGQVDVVYTDFEKAFDRVDHVILLAKLDKLGIHGDLLRWVKSYLTNRSQTVIVGGYRSDRTFIPSGIPQGSHLGPLFYNAYIFDIYNCFTSCKHLLYADDKKIYCKITSQDDCDKLQNTLNTLCSYYKINNITVNASKCQFISFTRKKKRIDYVYKINNIDIQRVNIVRDLGVILDSKLTMEEHINYITDKANKNLGFVIRTCKPFTDISCIRAVYYAYVRSTLEYCSSVWSPHYITYKEKIEKIQAKFIKHLNYRNNVFYDYRNGCSYHKLMQLDKRRTLLDMILLHNILNGQFDCPNLLSAINVNTPKYRTRNTPLFSIDFQTTNYAQFAPINRLCSTYNKFFSDIDIFNNSKYNFRNQVLERLIKQ